jgi:hypothetical protein
MFFPQLFFHSLIGKPLIAAMIVTIFGPSGISKISVQKTDAQKKEIIKNHIEKKSVTTKE